MEFVLDASVTMAWCFEDEVTPYSEAVLDHLSDGVAIVPPLWRLEVANVLLVGERRKRLTRARTERFLELLLTLPIHTAENIRDGFTPLVGLAREQELSAYDAAYLLLAARAGVPLASLDNNLRESAQHLGVPLVAA